MSNQVLLLIFDFKVCLRMSKWVELINIWDTNSFKNIWVENCNRLKYES